MNTTVVGAICNYRWPQIDTWWKSLRLTGFGGEIHLLVYGIDTTTIMELEKHHIHIHMCTLDGEQLVVKRFHDLARLIWAAEFDGWVIFPDVGDIVFQTNPAAYLEKAPQDKSLVAASEGITFSGNRWVRENMQRSFPEHWERMKDELLFNAGSLAGRGNRLAMLAERTYRLCQTKPGAEKHDQAAMNILLATEPDVCGMTWRRTAKDGWCFCGASSVFACPEDKAHYQDAWPVIKDAKCRVGDAEELVCMFHHYNRNPQLKRQVQNRVKAEWIRRPR